MRKLRECGGANKFNSGASRCKIPRGKIKGFILVERGTLLPDELTYEAMEKACHADEPNRIYPFGIVEEYAPSGGEGEVTQVGYGANTFSKLSARTEAFTMNEYDGGIVANLLEGKNIKFDFYLWNDAGYIFGMKNNEGKLAGAQASAIYPNVQHFDTSGDVANMIVNIEHLDFEHYLKMEDVVQFDFDMYSLKGLTEVEFVKVGSGENDYKLVENYGSLNISKYYGELFGEGASTIFENAVTSVKYDKGVLTITGSGIPILKKPSVLQENGILWIEQIEQKQ